MQVRIFFVQGYCGFVKNCTKEYYIVQLRFFGKVLDFGILKKR